MKKFIVYDSVTGRIKRTGYSSVKDFELQARDGESILEGDADSASEMIDILTSKVINIPIEAQNEAQLLVTGKQLKAYEINQKCRSSIVSGFVSSALEAPFNYPSKITDQQNLAASVLASYDPENTSTWTTPFWCSDDSGHWEFRPHTAAQIREVGRDAKSAILALQFKNEQLQAEIQAASTVEVLEAIAW